MSMKKRPRVQQESLWIAHDSVAKSPGHPFYEKLNEILQSEKFDMFVESKCRPHYAKKQGRPSIAPGVYFRMLLIGFFGESIRSVGFAGGVRTPYLCGVSWD